MNPPALQDPKMASMAIAAPSRVALVSSLVTQIPIILSTSCSSPLAPLVQLWHHHDALPAISLNVPGLIQELWEGILRAVPKKKPTHSKMRHRQMAGKALEDIRSLCKCPSCGRIKRMHVLCPYCVNSMWRTCGFLRKSRADHVKQKYSTCGNGRMDRKRGRPLL